MRLVTAARIGTVALAVACGKLTGVAGTAEPDGGAADADAPDAPAPPSSPDAASCVASDNVFCEDFDDVANVGALASRWQATLTGGGALDIESSEAASAPNGLRATTPGQDTIKPEAFLTHAIAPTGKPTSVTCEVDVRFDALGTMSSADVISLQVDADPSDTVVTNAYWAIFVDAPRMRLFASYTDMSGFHYVYLDVTTVDTTAWRHVRVTMDGAHTGRVRAYVDGHATADAEQGQPIPSVLGASQVNVGLRNVNVPATRWSYAVDNVRCAFD